MSDTTTQDRDALWADIRVHAVRSVCGCRCEQVASGEWRTVEPCEHHDEAAAMERALAAAPRERQGEEAPQQP